MILLALETSTARGSVALVDSTGRVLFHESFVTDRSHNSLLFAPLGRALKCARPDFVLAGTGPGSYTGTRIGLAAAHGLAVSLGVAWAAWPSITALADLPVHVAAGDARRGGAWMALIAGGRVARGPEMITIPELAARFAEGTPPAFTPDLRPLVEGLVPAHPDAVRLAEAFLAQDEGTRRAAATAPIEPIYLRAPFITTPARK